jgi:hypothetical protein
MFSARRNSVESAVLAVALTKPAPTIPMIDLTDDDIEERVTQYVCCLHEGLYCCNDLTTEPYYLCFLAWCFMA